MYDKIETQIRNLESLSVDTKTYANILTPIIIKLLPSDLALDFTRKTVDENLSLLALLDFLRKELLCKEHAKLINSERNNRLEDLNYKRENSSPTELLANSQKPNYGLRKVRNSKGGNGYSFNQSSPLNKRGDAGNESLFVFHRKKKEGSDALVSNVAHNNSEIYLQTAAGQFIGRKGSSLIRRIIFDGGSQRTFLESKLARKLNLPVFGQEILTVHTFQSERPTKHVYPKVRIRVKSLISNKEIEIEALETKQLSSAHISIPTKEVRERFESLGLELADVPVALDKGACEIGLLVRSDNYWKFVGNRIERLDESLVAVETIFGFCIHGSVSENKDNDEASVNLVSSIEYSGNRHKVGLPWKPKTKHLLDDNRENSIAYTADIEKASLQIELHEQDRDVALIFWTKNLNEFDPKNLQVYRLTRVLFGLTSSPFMLVASTRHHLKKYKDKFPDTAKIVESSLYVDDFISVLENVDKALQTSLESIEIFKEAGMSLRKWHTNSK
ncbi:DUF1758 domain-containing protein [Trichonephila clavata]|uniref:DUF1758 domain-containing protein n=1 Tax=Trichonephila clavata TaxID=2740835 RepID=A0A8X6KEA6_TRICU|nr:DUF1758 domain-containing protein [Trichonephila clavata]